MTRELWRRLERLERSLGRQRVKVQDLGVMTWREAEAQLEDWQQTGAYLENRDIVVRLRRFAT